MKIAISTDCFYVGSHFGRCPCFTFIEMDQDRILKKEIVSNPGHEPGLIPKFLKENGVECIITGGMGMRAIGLFQQYGIETILGIQGPIEDVLTQLKEGTLKGGESLCKPGAGKGYGLDKTVCDHPEEESCEHEGEKL